MKNIERVSIVEQVIQNLKAYIMENNLKPGDKMPTEKDVCELLGVGRSTAREAYRMLQAMNVVKTIQGKGVFICEEKVDNADFALQWFKENGKNVNDYMEVRMAIEPMGVRLAIPRATSVQIRQLQKTHSLFIKAREENNTIKLASYDEMFHNIIMECTGNQLLMRIQENIAECFREYRMKSFAIEDIMGNAIEPHQKIIDAFINRNAQLGYELMIDHLECSMGDIKKYSDN